MYEAVWSGSRVGLASGFSKRLESIRLAGQSVCHVNPPCSLINFCFVCMEHMQRRKTWPEFRDARLRDQMSPLLPSYLVFLKHAIPVSGLEKFHIIRNNRICLIYLKSNSTYYRFTAFLTFSRWVLHSSLFYN